MEILEDKYISDINYDTDSLNICHLNHSTEMSSIFQSVDRSCIDSLENNNTVNESYDSVSLRTTSSIENDFEVMSHDYSKIVCCLSTECFQRSDNEITMLSHLLQSIPEFMLMHPGELELVCQSARLVIMDTANTLIIKRYSTLTEWYFCLQGSLRKVNDDCVILTAGNSIGAAMENEELLISDYNLYSNCDNCKLMVIGKDDSKQLNELIIKTNDEDKTVIAVFETGLNESKSRQNIGYVITKGTPDVLINNLLCNSNYVHRDFVEDFFMTYKLYIPCIKPIMEELCKGLDEDSQESMEKLEILIRWISQNYTEFEQDEIKQEFMHKIETILINQKKPELLYLIYDFCSNHSSIRNVKTKISFSKNIVLVNHGFETMKFYINNVNDQDLLKNGDVILSIEEYTQENLTEELVQLFCDDQKLLLVMVRNDILGYHEHIIKDISVDSFSLYSTPSSSLHGRWSSDKASDTISVSTNDSDPCSPNTINISPNLKKRPSLIPNFFSTLQTGTVGRFFKNPKHYTKSILPNQRTISDQSQYIESKFERSTNMSASTTSIQRFSRRMKNQRKSAGSNPEIIKTFDEMDMNDHHSTLTMPVKLADTFPIRIYWKEKFLGRSDIPNNSNFKSELRCIHLMIKPTMPVSEVIILALLQLNVSSLSSNQFYLVEVKVDEANMMIHEKILKPTAINLRLKVQSRFYLKHNSIVGTSLILQTEAEKMINEFQTLSLINLSINYFVVRLFLRSHILLCNISPNELISHVTSSKSTLRINNHKPNLPTSDFDKYIQLSDFYKNWVITEICVEKTCPIKRSRIIKYFIWLAFKALHVGHIDLFFSLITGLDSTEISRLFLTWDEVTSRDRKLFMKLKSTLDVSGNMRNLRSLHKRMTSPYLPVTAMVIKDLTMIEETNPTFVEGSIKGLQVNKHLVNFEKMRKLSKLSRNFVNSKCSCEKDKSKPVRKHVLNCTSRLENIKRLEYLLLNRIENDIQPNRINHSISLDQKFSKKHSISSLSMNSSSSESISEYVGSLKNNNDQIISKAFDEERMYRKIELYLKKLEKTVISDPNKLLQMSIACEPPVQNTIKSNKTSNKTKNLKAQDDSEIINDHHTIKTEEISDKAAEILGLRTKSKIHKFKKSEWS